MADDINLAGLKLASFSQRLMIAFVDFLGMSLLNWGCFSFFLRASLMFQVVLPMMAYQLLCLVVLTWVLIRFGGSPAMLLLKFRVCDLDRKNLGVKAAVIRSLPFIVSSILYLNLLHTFILNIPGNALFLDNSGIVELMTLHSGGLFFVFRLWSFFYIPDLLFILFNHHSRTIVDTLSGSFVVMDS